MDKHDLTNEAAETNPNHELDSVERASFRAPRVQVVGSTRRALRGHHGMGQEPQGYAPKQG